MLSVVALMHTHMLTQIHLDTENKRERERETENKAPVHVWTYHGRELRDPRGALRRYGVLGVIS